MLALLLASAAASATPVQTVPLDAPRAAAVVKLLADVPLPDDATWEAAGDRCEAGDAEACLVRARGALTLVRDQRGSAVWGLDRACALGREAACGLSDTLPPDAELGGLWRCLACLGTPADRQACTELAVVAEGPTRTRALERACDLHDLWACERLALDAISPDEERRALSRGCLAGDRSACEALPPEVRRDVLARVPAPPCPDGLTPACRDEALAVVSSPMEAVHFATFDATAPLVDAACEAGDAEACLARGRSFLTAGHRWAVLSTGPDPSAREAFVAACETDLAEGCLALADLLAPDGPDDVVDPALDRAVALGSDEAFDRIAGRDLWRADAPNASRLLVACAQGRAEACREAVHWAAHHGRWDVAAAALAPVPPDTSVHDEGPWPQVLRTLVGFALEGQAPVDRRVRRACRRGDDAACTVRRVWDRLAEEAP